MQGPGAGEGGEGRTPAASSGLGLPKTTSGPSAAWGGCGMPLPPSRRPDGHAPLPRPSTTGRSASGRPHSASRSSLTPALPTCGSPRSTANCWTSPAVSHCPASCGERAGRGGPQGAGTWPACHLLLLHAPPARHTRSPGCWGCHPISGPAPCVGPAGQALGLWWPCFSPSWAMLHLHLHLSATPGRPGLSVSLGRPASQGPCFSPGQGLGGQGWGKPGQGTSGRGQGWRGAGRRRGARRGRGGRAAG